ncbi:DUF6382 domain-containing protein [Paenibacillus sp. S150]|uniref:DUF6382 domain-containing protein n=1 Tax=Paenibacillus sp. S150 TaxID=2749826 RepID=UPI001C5790E1|nr:DUF6382 domain-containing protein [Paenibacillus sp. S150]MBW4083438.1 FHA domain-containing protein [Paenibacillus sp. S150]
MFGLSRDFVQQDGISMLLGKPEGLRTAELNMVQVRMLMNTGIPHHLRLQLREIDLQVSLEYALSRRKMLSHLLKGEKLGMTEFFGLLLQIAVGMEEGRLYMLQAEQYALHEDYIFIEGPLRAGKVYLTYLPLQSAESAMHAGEALKLLIMVLMASVRELSGDGVQRLLQYCGEEDFTPAGLKELLAELMTDGEGAKRRADTARSASVVSFLDAHMTAEGSVRERNGATAEVDALASEKLRNDPGFESAAAEAHKPPPWQGGYPRLKLKEESLQLRLDEPDIDSHAAPEPSAYRTYAMLGGLLVDAVLWKFLYLNSPKPPGLAVCALATLVLGMFCWLVWSGRLNLGGVKAEEAAEDELAAAGRRKHRELEWDFVRTPAAASGAPDVPVPAQKFENPLYTGVQTTQNRAGLPERSQATAPAPIPVEATAMLLHDPPSEKERKQEVHAAPYLERVHDNEGGIPEKIELNRPSFLIGRSPDVAQYVEKSEGVSRVHAEIAKSAGGYILKDLDSRNGTLFQGEAMIPYKEYPLTDGTMFTIVKGCYTFRSV